MMKNLNIAISLLFLFSSAFSCSKVTQSRDKIIIPAAALGPKTLVARHIQIPKEYSWENGQVIITRTAEINKTNESVLYIEKKKALLYINRYQNRSNRNLTFLKDLKKIIEWNID